MHLRIATIEDTEQLKALYQGTIREINSRHYNPTQIIAWAATGEKIISLHKKINEQYFYVAETSDGHITGFASLENDGELDMMYVHKDFQGNGIAAMLINRIFEKAVELGLQELTAYVSITAKPFFEKQGFVVVAEQEIMIGEVALTNYEMKREL
jgi:putative acetyltransferase